MIRPPFSQTSAPVVIHLPRTSTHDVTSAASEVSKATPSPRYHPHEDVRRDSLPQSPVRQSEGTPLPHSLHRPTPQQRILDRPADRVTPAFITPCTFRTSDTCHRQNSAQVAHTWKNRIPAFGRHPSSPRTRHSYPNNTYMHTCKCACKSRCLGESCSPLDRATRARPGHCLADTATV
jgi:hypothetical protein